MASVVHPTDDTPTLPTTTLHGGNGNGKLKRFRFIEAYDLSLLKAVRCINAHIPAWGKAESLYDEVLKLFLRDISDAVLVHSQKPSAKTLVDRFKRLVARRREDVKRKSAASGIIEVHGEKELLLDDLITEIDEKEESARAEKELQSNNERQLVAAGECIRVNALKRKRGETENVEEGDSSARSSAKKTRAKRRELSQSDDEVTAAILRHGEAREEMEKDRLELLRNQMKREDKKAERDEKRFARMQEATTRRLDLDEKRFELEKEERKKSLVEQQKMIDVMEMLCKKLG